MEPTTQTDFYKGIFLTAILPTITGFDFANLAGQSEGVIPNLSGEPMPDAYAKLKVLSEEFADIMINGVQPPQP